MTSPLLLLALLATAPPTVRVEVQPAEITVGDPATAVVVVEGTSAPPVIGPWQATWGEAEIREVEPLAPAGPESWRQTVHLTAFRTGSVVLPPPEVVAGGVRLAADPATLEVRSVLPEGEQEPAPRPPAPPVPLPTPAAFWWLLAALVSFAVAAAALLVERERGRRRETSPQPAMPPFEELLGVLATLPAASPEPGHTALSLALRRYLGRALGFHAAESTTSEIGRQLAARDLGRELARGAVQLLRDCDQVKFARRPASPAELAVRVETARGIAAEIDAGLRSVAVETEAAA